MSEDEVAGWHHRGNGCECGQNVRDGEGQRGLACCGPWGHKELDATWHLNNSNSQTEEKLSCFIVGRELILCHWP